MAEPSYVPSMPGLLTADELLHLSIPDKRAELVRGVLVVRSHRAAATAGSP